MGLGVEIVLSVTHMSHDTDFGIQTPAQLCGE
jgi:hypothetical protein